MTDIAPVYTLQEIKAACAQRSRSVWESGYGSREGLITFEALKNQLEAKRSLQPPQHSPERQLVFCPACDKVEFVRKDVITIHCNMAMQPVKGGVERIGSTSH